MDFNQDVSEKEMFEDDERQSKKSIKKWIASSVDKYMAKAIKNKTRFRFKFLDNTFLEGYVKWFNKYNMAVSTDDEKEYVCLKHSVKYMKSISSSGQTENS